MILSRSRSMLREPVGKDIEIEAALSDETVAGISSIVANSLRGRQSRHQRAGRHGKWRKADHCDR